MKDASQDKPEITYAKTCSNCIWADFARLGSSFWDSNGKRVTGTCGRFGPTQSEAHMKSPKNPAAYNNWFYGSNSLNHSILNKTFKEVKDVSEITLENARITCPTLTENEYNIYVAWHKYWKEWFATRRNITRTSYCTEWYGLMRRSLTSKQQVQLRKEWEEEHETKA